VATPTLATRRAWLVGGLVSFVSFSLFACPDKFVQDTGNRLNQRNPLGFKLLSQWQDKRQEQ